MSLHKDSGAHIKLTCLQHHYRHTAAAQKHKLYVNSEDIEKKKTAKKQVNSSKQFEKGPVMLNVVHRVPLRNQD